MGDLIMAIRFDPSRVDEPGYLDWLRSWNVRIPDNINKPAEPAEAASKRADEPVLSETGPGPNDLYADWTKNDLQAELARRDLPTTGNKPDLIDRLRTADEAVG